MNAYLWERSFTGVVGSGSYLIASMGGDEVEKVV